MPRYRYKAKKSAKETIEGVMDEASADVVADILIKQNLTPVNIILETQSTPAANTASASTASLPQKTKRKKVKLKDVYIFARQLHTLLKSRVELLSCLRMIQDQEKNIIFKQVIQDLYNSIKDGLSFSRALDRHPEVFPKLFVNIINSGEASGKLDESLEQICIYLARIEDLKMKLRQALAYPLIMIIVGAISVFILITFIIPRLAGMFSDLEVALPLPTRLLLQLGDFLKNWWPAVIISFFVFLQIIRRGFGKKKFGGQLKYRIPVISKLFYKQTIINFSTTMGLLLKSGLPLLECLRISSSLIDERHLAQDLNAATEKVRAGMTLSQGLSNSKFFAGFLMNMLRVGEEGGRLVEIMSDISNSYSLELESDLKIVSSLIEPIIILILGVVIGVIVLSMLLPIFQINVLAR